MMGSGLGQHGGFVGGKEGTKVGMERSRKWVVEGGLIEMAAQKWPGKADMKEALWACYWRLGL